MASVADSRALNPWQQLWAGSAGAVTQAHYDVADNVFVQLHGTKEFLCWPPSAHEALHLFPDAHPRARKSQVTIEQPDLEMHPLMASLPAPLRIVLEPGSAIALPAFWLHHVTAKTESVSLNVFSESPLKLAAAEVFGRDLPLHASWPTNIRRDGLAVVICALADALAISPAKTLGALLESRFAPLSKRASVDHAQVPSVAARRRRRKAPVPVPQPEELRMALLLHAQATAEAFRRLRISVHEATPAWEARWDGTATPCDGDATWPTAWRSAEGAAIASRDSTLWHVLEMWTLRAFGPTRLESELRALLRRFSQEGERFHD